MVRGKLVGEREEIGEEIGKRKAGRGKEEIGEGGGEKEEIGKRKAGRRNGGDW